MAQILRMNNQPLPNPLTLIAGSKLAFKVAGLGADRRHVQIRSSSANVKIKVVRADDRNLEQTLQLEVDAGVSRRNNGTLTAYLASDPEKKDETTPVLQLVIEVPLALPVGPSADDLLTRMLLAENIAPGDPDYVSREETLKAMQWMRIVFENRLSFGPQFFKARGARTLSQLIMAPGQVEGFERYPVLDPRVQKLIEGLLDIANGPIHPQRAAMRLHVQDAMAVARGSSPGATDPSERGLYAWRTAGSSGPGKQFVLFKRLGGQDFYTITPEFEADPLQRDVTKQEKAQP